MVNRMAGIPIRVLLAPNRCTLFAFEGMHARELVHHSDIATQCAVCISLRDPRDRFAGKESQLCIFPLLLVAQHDLAIS